MNEENKKVKTYTDLDGNEVEVEIQNEPVIRRRGNELFEKYKTTKWNLFGMKTFGASKRRTPPPSL